MKPKTTKKLNTKKLPSFNIYREKFQKIIFKLSQSYSFSGNFQPKLFIEKHQTEIANETKKTQLNAVLEAIWKGNKKEDKNPISNRNNLNAYNPNSSALNENKSLV